MVWACQAVGRLEAVKEIPWIETTVQKTCIKAPEEMAWWSWGGTCKERTANWRCRGEKDLRRPRDLEKRCQVFAGWQMKIYQEDGEKGEKYIFSLFLNIVWDVLCSKIHFKVCNVLFIIDCYLRKTQKSCDVFYNTFHFTILSEPWLIPRLVYAVILVLNYRGCSISIFSRVY